MLSGFNTNFRYRGVLFHIQTEDSGTDNPHVCTHLFKGGDILASHKGDYADKLGNQDLEAEVRALMELQHKSMLRALSRGEHDQLIIDRIGPDVFKDEGSTDTDATLPPPETPRATPEAVVTATELEARPKRDSMAWGFGDSVVSQKPLDEVVLDYLVDNARKRKRSPK